MTNLQTLKNAATGTAVEKPKNIMNLLGEEKAKKQLAALAGKYMTGDRMLALCVNAVRKTPLLAQCDPTSVLGAMMAAAALGLEPNTPVGHAYLIPYKKRVKRGNDWIDAYECQFQIGYKGYIALAYRHPNVLSIEAEAIHENDTYEHLQGSTGLVTFKKALRERGEMIGAYCLIKLKDGGEVAVTLPLEEIYKVRAKSETYRSLVRNVSQAENEKDRVKAQQKLDETPWVMWEDTMAAKTAIKALISHRMPLSSQDALSVANQVDDRNIDLSALTNPATAAAVFHEGDEPPALEEQHFESVPTTIHQHEGEAVPAGGTVDAQQAQSTSDAPIVTPQSVEEAMRAAFDKRDRDALDEAAGVINTLPMQEQKRLHGLYKQHLKDLDE